MLIEVLLAESEVDFHAIPVTDVRRILLSLPCNCRTGMTNIITGKPVTCRTCMLIAQLEGIRDVGLLELELGSSES